MKYCSILLLFCASLTWGQMNANYQHTESSSWVSNIPNCKTGGHNCWHHGNATLSGIYSAGGLTYGILANGQVTKYTDYPVNSWAVQSAMGTVSLNGLAIGSGSVIYALKTDSACGANLHVVKWSGTAWVNTTGCAIRINAANDGTVLAINALGQAFTSTDQGNTWTQIASTQTWWNGSIGTATSVALVKTSTGEIYNWAGGTLTKSTGIGVEVALDAIVGVMYVIDFNGNAYRQNGTGWDQLVGVGGPMTHITNGGMMNIWAIGPTQGGSNVWRFPDQAMLQTTNLTGNSGCPPNCNTATHTPHAQMYVTGTSKTFGGTTVTGSGVTPPTQINLSASGGVYDPFDCFESGACEFTFSDSVDCTVAGAGFFAASGSGPILTTQREVAFTKMRSTGGPTSAYGCFTFPVTKITLCSYPVESWCANTLFPDYDPPGVREVQGDWFPYWIGWGWCTRDAANGVPTEDWQCLAGVSLGTEDSTQNHFCDYNPR